MRILVIFLSLISHFPLVKPTDATALEKWELQNEKALSLLHSSLSNNLCIHIENTSTAWSAWE